MTRRTSQLQIVNYLPSKIRKVERMGETQSGSTPAKAVLVKRTHPPGDNYLDVNAPQANFFRMHPGRTPNRRLSPSTGPN